MLLDGVRYYTPMTTYLPVPGHLAYVAWVRVKQAQLVQLAGGPEHGRIEAARRMARGAQVEAVVTLVADHVFAPGCEGGPGERLRVRLATFEQHLGDGLLAPGLHGSVLLGSPVLAVGGGSEPGQGPRRPVRTGGRLAARAAGRPGRHSGDRLPLLILVTLVPPGVGAAGAQPPRNRHRGAAGGPAGPRRVTGPSQDQLRSTGRTRPRRGMIDSDRARNLEHQRPGQRRAAAGPARVAGGRVRRLRHRHLLPVRRPATGAGPGRLRGRPDRAGVPRGHLCPGQHPPRVPAVQHRDRQRHPRRSDLVRYCTRLRIASRCW